MFAALVGEFGSTLVGTDETSCMTSILAYMNGQGGSNNAPISSFFYWCARAGRTRLGLYSLRAYMDMNLAAAMLAPAPSSLGMPWSLIPSSIRSSQLRSSQVLAAGMHNTSERDAGNYLCAHPLNLILL